jgi:hypothetical protein
MLKQCLLYGVRSGVSCVCQTVAQTLSGGEGQNRKQVRKEKRGKFEKHEEKYDNTNE